MTDAAEVDDFQMQATNRLIRSAYSVVNALKHSLHDQLQALQIADAALDDFVEAFGLFTRPDEDTLSHEAVADLEAALAVVLNQPDSSKRMSLTNLVVLWAFKACASSGDHFVELPDKLRYLTQQLRQYRRLRAEAISQLSHSRLSDALSPFTPYLEHSLPLESRRVPSETLYALMRVLHAKASRELGVSDEV